MDTEETEDIGRRKAQPFEELDDELINNKRWTGSLQAQVLDLEDKIRIR